MNKTLKIITLALTLMLALLMFTGCTNRNKPEERVFRVNDSTAFDNFLSPLMREKKLLEKYLPEGVSIEWTYLTTGSDIRDGIITGSIDIGSMNAGTMTTAMQNNMPLSFVEFSGANLVQLWARDPSIKTLSDLKASHKISVSSFGGGPHIDFLLAAQDDMGDASFFSKSMITMTNSDAIAALISGTTGVDAIVCSFPSLIALWNSDNTDIHLVRDFRDVVFDHGAVQVYCTTTEFAEKNPDIMEAFLKAYHEAINMLTNDKEACIEVMMKVYDGCTEEIANEMLDFYADTFDVGVSKYDDLNEFLYENGILEKPAELFENIPKFEASK